MDRSALSEAINSDLNSRHVTASGWAGDRHTAAPLLPAAPYVGSTCFNGRLVGEISRPPESKEHSRDEYRKGDHDDCEHVLHPAGTTGCVSKWSWMSAISNSDDVIDTSESDDGSCRQGYDPGRSVSIRMGRRAGALALGYRQQPRSAFRGYRKPTSPFIKPGELLGSSWSQSWLVPTSLVAETLVKAALPVQPPSLTSAARAAPGRAPRAGRVTCTGRR
jgi:hypothetical protein